MFRNSPKNYDRAEEILQRVLERPNLEDRDVVVERLESLRAEGAQATGRKSRKRRRRQRRR